MQVLLQRKQDSVVVFEKIRTRRVYATLLKLLLKASPQQTVYDIDDADYLKFPPQTIEHFIRYSSRCTVGSQRLADFATAHNPQVSILTSPVVDHGYVKQSRNSVFTIGWIGYYTAHQLSLQELLFPAIAQLTFPVKLVLMGVKKQEHIQEVETYFSQYLHVTVCIPQDIDWQNETSVYQQVAAFDVGVAPLLDTEVNRAKSAFKLKQYLSCGVPALASATGENEHFLQDGSNGFLCNTSTEYAMRLEQLVQMSDADYRQLSANALRSKASFSMQQYCTCLLHVFRLTVV